MLWGLSSWNSIIRYPKSNSGWSQIYSSQKCDKYALWCSVLIFFWKRRQHCCHALSQLVKSQDLTKYEEMTRCVVLYVLCCTFQYINQYVIIFQNAFTLFVLTAFVYFLIKLLVLCTITYWCVLFCEGDMHFFKVEVWLFP